MLFRAMLITARSAVEFVCLSLSTKTIASLGTGCFYTILTVTFAKKRGGKGLLCLYTSYVPDMAQGSMLVYDSAPPQKTEI